MSVVIGFLLGAGRGGAIKKAPNRIRRGWWSIDPAQGLPHDVSHRPAADRKEYEVHALAHGRMLTTAPSQGRGGAFHEPADRRSVTRVPETIVSIGPSVLAAASPADLILSLSEDGPRAPPAEAHPSTSSG
jgi:hypothetical protein